MADKKAILVLEDEDVLSRALRIALENEGFEVDVASSGEVAIDKINENQFDFFLLDLVIPGIDGFEVLKKIREKNTEALVFVLSNLSDDESKERAKKLGADEYFVKSETLLSEISSYIKKRAK
ncbi:response regulator [Patescibacteria group bacterium]|nr:response regulator [Patescibacteria group bacterium]